MVVVWCGDGGGDTTANGLMEGERSREEKRAFFFFFFVVREIEREGGVGVGGCLGSLLGEVLISTYEAAVVCKLSSSFKF